MWTRIPPLDRWTTLFHCNSEVSGSVCPPPTLRSRRCGSAGAFAWCLPGHSEPDAAESPRRRRGDAAQQRLQAGQSQGGRGGAAALRAGAAGRGGVWAQRAGEHAAAAAGAHPNRSGEARGSGGPAESRGEHPGAQEAAGRSWPTPSPIHVEECVKPEQSSGGVRTRTMKSDDFLLSGVDFWFWFCRFSLSVFPSAADLFRNDFGPQGQDVMDEFRFLQIFILLSWRSYQVKIRCCIIWSSAVAPEFQILFSLFGFLLFLIPAEGLLDARWSDLKIIVQSWILLCLRTSGGNRNVSWEKELQLVWCWAQIPVRIHPGVPPAKTLNRSPAASDGNC